MLRVRTLLVAASLELAITGFFLFLLPELFSRLVFGADLLNAGVAVARFAGIALLTFGAISWPRPKAPDAAAMIVPALSIYNFLATVYLAYLGYYGLAGPLLWPAVAVHAVLAVVFIRAFVLLERSNA